MSVTRSSRLDTIAWQVVRKLPLDGDPNQDLLCDLADEKSIEELARQYASGNIAIVRNRIRIQWVRLGISFDYTTPGGIEILKRAFELFDQNAPKAK